MPQIKNFIYQSDEHKCIFAVIRMIRESCEGGTFSDEDVLEGFEDKSTAIRGPNVAEIEKYWQDLKIIYQYKKGDNQSLQQIQSNKEHYAMIIVNKN